MVLSEELTSAVKYDEEGVVEAVHTWLHRLERPLVLARRAQEDRSIVGLLRPRSLGHSSHGSLDNADRNPTQPGQIARGEGRRIANVPVFIPRHRAARCFGKLYTRVRNN